MKGLEAYGSVGPRFRDLGSIQIEVDGTIRPPGGARPTAALAILLMNANRRVPAESLMTAMWGDRDRSPSTLDSHVWRLRQAIEPTRARGVAPTVVINDTGGYRLVVTPDQVDSLRFEQLAANAADLLRSGQSDRALRRAQEALTLWRGRPFGSVADELWAIPAVTRLEEIHAQVSERQIDALLAVGDPEGALVQIEAAISEHQLRERLWVQRMTAAYRCGRVDEALDTFQRARSVLLDALGVEPGVELRNLQRQILANDSNLATATPPPLHVPRPVETHLPRPLTRLIGRSADVEQLSALCLTNRLVTIVGTAGCGKTKLAIDVAWSVSQEFVDGLWFVDLTAAADRGQVLDAVISAIGVAPAVSGTATDVLRSFTRDRRMLLVLDNCEHILDVVAVMMESLLVQGSELVVLATSREPLDVDGEMVHCLYPLALPRSGQEHAGDLPSSRELLASPAVQLFLDRITIGDRKAEPDPEQLRLTAEICVAVDGVPLAIELAAARARSHSLAEISQQVSTDPSTLGRIGRGGAAHHRSVRAAIEWSHQLLPEAEQRVHRRLSVIPGAFTAAAAAAIAGLDRVAVEDVLAGLVHRSFLVPRGPARPGGPSLFAQLATLRGHGAYALAQAGETGQTLERRNSWIAEVIRRNPRLGSTDEAAFFDALDDDLACLRATLQQTLVETPCAQGVFAVSRMGMYWYYRGMVLEGRRWDQLAVAVGSADPFDRAMARMSLAGSWGLNNRLDVAKPLIEKSLAEAGRTPFGAGVIFGDRIAAQAAPMWLAGDYPFVTELAHRMMEIADRNDDQALAVIAEVFLAGTRVAPDAQLADLARLEDAFDRAVAVGNHFAAWLAAGFASMIAMFLGDPIIGLNWSNRSIEQHMRHHVGEGAVTLEIRGNLLIMAGDPVGAVRLYSAARFHNQRAGIAWPSAAGTTAMLATATGMLDPETLDSTWNAGSILTLADIYREITATQH